MLVITKYLLGRNVFKTIEMAARARARRWAAGWDCAGCRVPSAKQLGAGTVPHAGVGASAARSGGRKGCGEGVRGQGS